MKVQIKQKIENENNESNRQGYKEIRKKFRKYAEKRDNSIRGN